MIQFSRCSTYVLLAFVLTIAACDSVDDSGFSVEVTEIKAVETSFGAPALRVTFQNTGSEPLDRAEIEITVHPQTHISSGVSVAALDPGVMATGDVVLLHVDSHSEYSCYSSRVIAFAPGEKYAVVDQTGPRTCR